MADEREIRYRGRPWGRYRVGELFRARMSGEFDATTEFFSERKERWLPIAGILEDLHPTEEKLRSLRAIKVTQVRIVGGGNKEECASCRALAEKVYGIENVPVIPPAGCACVPWCGLDVVADFDQEYIID